MSNTRDEQRGQPSHQFNGRVEYDLAVKLGEFARALQDLDTSEKVLDRIVQVAIDLIPGAEEGSISVVRLHRHVESQSQSGQLPTQADAAQNQTGEGPCLDAAYLHKTVRIEDMRSENRWPKFANDAASLGAMSMLALQLYVEEDNLGALNLFSRTPRAFTDQSEEIGLLVAEHAAVAFATEQKLTQLGEALSSRDLIGQAKGILMERHKIQDDAAFALLIKASQDRNLKLREVAQRLTTTGELPGAPHPSDPRQA